MKTKILNILLYLLLAVMWCGILFVSFIFLLLNDIVAHFGNGILKIVFVFIYMCALALPIIFRRKLKADWMLPLFLILATVLAMVSNGILYNFVDNYVSTYSRAKWDSNAELRFYMVDSLEEQFDFIGKTEQEVRDILGEPANVAEYGGWRVFEYYIGDDYIDPYTYDIRFENGIVMNSGVTQH